MLMQQPRRKENYIQLTKSTEDFLTFLKQQVDEEGNYAISTRKQLEEAYGKSRSVIDRKLKELSEKGIINCFTKRGKNGGTIITLNYFKPKDYTEWVQKDESIISSNKKYARDLKERVFPKYERPLGQGRPRRTKEEMRAYKLARTAHEKLMVEMNQRTSILFPSKEVFNMAPDPEGYYKAYTMAKLYDYLCYAYMKQAYQDHKNISNPTEKEKSAIEVYKNYMEYYRHGNILGEDFFGTKLFNTFYNAYKKLSDSKLMMPIEAYLQSVFKNYVTTFEYYRGTKYAPKSPVPYPNFLHSERALKDFYQHRNYLRARRSAYDSYVPIERYVARIGAESNVYKAIVRLFDRNLHDEVEPIIDNKFETNMLTRGLYNNLTGQLSKLDELQGDQTLIDTMSQYKEYLTTKESLDTKVEDKEDNSLLTRFLKQLYMLKTNPMKLTSFDRAVMYPVQQRYYYEHMSLRGYIEEHPEEAYQAISAVNQPISLANEDNFTRNGEEYCSIANGTGLYQIINMYMEYMDTALNVHEVSRLIKKYELEDTIVLDKNGLLK